MDMRESAQESAGQQYVQQFLEQLSDPIHKRLIRAYKGEDPVASMEAELAKVLREALGNADQKHNGRGVSRVQRAESG